MLLKNGSKGEDVKKLQEKLGLKADGSFGPGTEAAVKKWQESNGLKADGIVGDSTWEKLFGSVVSAPVTVVQTVGEVKLEKLKGHVPDAVLSQIPEVMAKFNCNTPLRLAHFLAQCGHESGGFKAVTENLNYSADGLKKIFGKYFPGDLANSYAKNPEKIASRVYANRMENGDEASKEGWKFRGRGYLQTTGKGNYKKLGLFLGVDLISNPDLVASTYALASAGFFFDSNKLWSICDEGTSDDVVSKLTKKINGGYLGLEHRSQEFKKFIKILC
jgi:putative chitinase